jgi:hypothetical protein
MSTTVQIIGGNFQDSQGNLLVNGYLTFTLSQDAQANGTTNICAGREIKILLNSSGSISTSPAQYIWPNDVLTPSNTFYVVRGYTSAGQLVWGPNSQQVLSSPSPFDVGAWYPNVSNVAAPITETVYDIGMYFPGTYSNAQTLLQLALDRTVVFASTLAPSTAVCTVNPTSSVSLSLTKNGSSFGTLYFTTGGVGSYSSSGITFQKGDVLEITAPVTADGTLAGVGVILSGVLG